MKGDGYVERSKDDYKSVMKNKWRSIEGGGKKEGCPAWGSCSSWGGKGAAATYSGFICAARGRTRCVLGGVVIAGGLCTA